MKKPTVIKSVLFCLFIFAGELIASTVPSSPTFVLSPRGVGLGTKQVVATDANQITGQYAVCWATDAAPQIRCTHRELNNTEIQLITIPDALLQNAENLSVNLSDSGDIYILWSTSTPNAFVVAYDDQGVELFPRLSVFNDTLADPKPWSSVSLALTPNGFWVVGSRLTFNGEDTNMALRYAADSTLLETLIDEVNPDGIDLNCQASVASNRSGDLIISWIEFDHGGFPSNCLGNIVARIYRESGNPISDYLYLTDDNSPAFNSNPVVAASESGEFMVAYDFDDGIDTITSAAKIVMVGNTASFTSQEVVNGTNPRVSSDSDGDEFAVIANDNSIGPNCVSQARFALRGDWNPETKFTATSCDVFMIDIALLNNDSML